MKFRAYTPKIFDQHCNFKTIIFSEFRRPSLVFQSTIATATTTTTLTTTTTTTLIANKSNAETQTALRGVSIVPTSEMKIYREIDNESSSANSQTGL